MRSDLWVSALIGIGIGTGLMFCAFVPSIYVWIKSIAVSLMSLPHILNRLDQRITNLEQR